ncbi:tRNA threonylcarbamoyladenosine biosynthesis protein TsaE [Alteromonadaceae bacterium Bs31]|nr:tRNA threonylcarbamoyladenosine biosynthesis protein TsaE [Alteromonadaceae bacterium Bs31]
MQKQLEIHLQDEAATVVAGRSLAENLDNGLVLYLDGVLGAGKTTFCRGILQAFGHSGAVKSPTYTLVEPYELAKRKVFHFDLYRLGDPEELEYMGIRDYFQPGHICLVEWPEKGRGFLPEADLIAKVVPEAGGRKLTIMSGSELGSTIVARML